ncbi:Golgi apyrase [Mycena sanguinolenta]|uniref:Golgi apyrase n=1 Tax=Mycena sanguinolenta TaxID=230812 RepID=A0A8H6ZD42_9AGAR|nr:Golgi apyrase [Mycena sanguinolenta]
MFSLAKGLTVWKKPVVILLAESTYTRLFIYMSFERRAAAESQKPPEIRKVFEGSMDEKGGIAKQNSNNVEEYLKRIIAEAKNFFPGLIRHIPIYLVCTHAMQDLLEKLDFKDKIDTCVSECGFDAGYYTKYIDKPESVDDMVKGDFRNLAGCQVLKEVALFAEDPSTPSCPVVILDAGSSGTRLFIYMVSDWNAAESKEPPKIQMVFRGPKDEKLGKGGIAKRNSDNVKEYLEPIIEEARKYFGGSWISVIPLYVLCTAGMRDLPKESQEPLENAIKTYLKNCGFDGSLPQKYGYLEMGGASAQIAFLPHKHELRPEQLGDGDMTRVTLGDVHFDLFLKTYDLGSNKAWNEYEEELKSIGERDKTWKYVEYQRDSDGSWKYIKIDQRDGGRDGTWKYVKIDQRDGTETRTYVDPDRSGDRIKIDQKAETWEYVKIDQTDGVSTPGDPIIDNRKEKTEIRKLKCYFDPDSPRNRIWTNPKVPGVEFCGTGDFQPSRFQEKVRRVLNCLAPPQHARGSRLLDEGLIKTLEGRRFVGGANFWYSTRAVFGKDIDGKPKRGLFSFNEYDAEVNRTTMLSWPLLKLRLPKKEDIMGTAWFVAVWVKCVLAEGFGFNLVDQAVNSEHELSFRPYHGPEGEELTWTLGKAVQFAAGDDVGIEPLTLDHITAKHKQAQIDVKNEKATHCQELAWDYLSILSSLPIEGKDAERARRLEEARVVLATAWSMRQAANNLSGKLLSSKEHQLKVVRELQDKISKAAHGYEVEVKKVVKKADSEDLKKALLDEAIENLATPVKTTDGQESPCIC